MLDQRFFCINRQDLRVNNRADKFYKHLLQIIASLENYIYYYLHGVDAEMRF